MRVLKFGGACLESHERLQMLVGVVQRAPGRRAVVVSAVSGVTDRLHALLEADSHTIHRQLAELHARHRELAPAGAQVDHSIDAIIRSLETQLRSTRPHSAPARERIISTGERLAAVLVAAHLRAAGMAAEVFSSERAGIRCDDRFGEALVDHAATERGVRGRLRPALERGSIPVVTGYYGVTRDGDVATFGRSGTDYSATAIARALLAERVEMYKVVGGFLSADPNLIAEAHVIPKLSYEEATELAVYGARVIHPRALEPARAIGVPIHVLDLEEPGATGTRIAAEPSHDNGLLTAVSVRRNLTVIRAFGPGTAGHQDALTAVGLSLARSGIKVVNTMTAQTSLGLMVDSRDAERALAAVELLPNALADRIQCDPDVALLCAVGHGLGHTRGMVGRLLCSMVSADVNVDLVCAGASPVACHVAIANHDVEIAARAVYDEFFLHTPPSARLCIYADGTCSPAERDAIQLQACRPEVQS